MQTDKRVLFTFIVFIIFIIGGFVGTGVWFFLIPVCLSFLVKTYLCGALTSGGIRISLVDYYILGVCIAEILTCTSSAYLHNSIDASAPVVMLAFFWFFFRAVFEDRKTAQHLIKVGSLLALLFSFITIVTFINFKSEFLSYGTSITNFKQEYRPLMIPVNDWVAFLICSLPYPFAAAFSSKDKLKRFFHYTVAALLTASIILSLSRGAYLALAAFFLVSGSCLIATKSKQFRGDIGIIALSAFIGLLAVIPANKEVLTTCAMSRTTSQVLSIQGRLQLVDDCISIWKEKPLTGVGAGNFNIVYDSSIANRKASSTRATNAYALILVEKGAIGIIAYCGLAIVALICGLARVKKGPVTLFSYACFAALCVRGLFFSSLFERRAVMMMTVLVLFMMFQDNCCNEVSE